jgi:hypothetical protein
MSEGVSVGALSTVVMAVGSPIRPQIVGLGNGGRSPAFGSSPIDGYIIDDKKSIVADFVLYKVRVGFLLGRDRIPPSSKDFRLRSYDPIAR